MRESGLLNHWIDKSITDRDRCLKKFKDKTPSSPSLSLENMSSSFIVLVIGYIIALLLFIWENISNLCSQKSFAKLPAQPVVVVKHLGTIIIQDLVCIDHLTIEQIKETEEAKESDNKAGTAEHIEENQQIVKTEQVTNSKFVQESKMSKEIGILIELKK